MDLRPTLSFLTLLFLCFYFTTSVSDALPVKSVRQYLPPKPGYIPVYIQDGDTPPDVESIYETQDDQNNDQVDQDSEEQLLDDSSLRELRQSEEFIIQQLTDSIKENEVQGMAEEMPKGNV